MSKTILGKVSVVPKKIYSNTTTYKRLDIVTHEGSSYLCLKDCTGIEVTNTEYWQLLAKKGEKGNTGEQGIQGKTGPQGPEGKQGPQGIQGKTGPQGPAGRDGTNGVDGYTPQKGIDYFTEEEKTEFKNAVVADSKTDIDTHTANKIKEFNDNSTAKLKEYNDNATAKLKEYNDNDTAKTEAYNNNATEKINTFNSNAEAKLNEFNENAETLTNRVTALARRPRPADWTLHQGAGPLLRQRRRRRGGHRAGHDRPAGHRLLRPGAPAPPAQDPRGRACEAGSGRLHQVPGPRRL